ncbi:hypothetical protein ACFOGJ_17570 [Marinibaculum pumilum]|uniref:Uncharacterized protein n=1 Tax=Marinibaculum pumilum TaxID=1766165 RepID=A0ABV7L3R1_9PROT
MRTCPIAIPVLALLLAAATAGQALACGPRAEVLFTEGAPDSFEIVNRSPPGWEIESLQIDLRGAVGGLYFDPTEGGAGTSMPDPLRPLGSPDGGTVRLVGASPVADGDTALLLAFEGFAAGARYILTIDLDNLGGGYANAVIEPGEFAGASLFARFAAGPHRAEGEGLFDGAGRAETLDNSACS